MQTELDYRTNRDLFSNHYLDDHLPDTEAWTDISEEELQEAYDDIKDLWEREKETAPQRNESQLEERFIRPMFRKLGIPFEVEESVQQGQRRPDYAFFETEEAARNAFQRRENDEDFYQNSIAVADAKRWGRALDTRGERERDFENPSYQIHVYLQETPTQWAVLTNGQKWRLYYGPTSHRLDSYYEVDLPTILEQGDLDDFKYFYLFFRHEAFLEDTSGDSFLDDIYSESNIFAQELGEDLQDNIYEAIGILAEGFLKYPDNDLDEETLQDNDLISEGYADFENQRLSLIHDSALIYLYRLIFVLYAESEGRELLDTNNEIYEQSYSLNTLKQEVVEELDSVNPQYRDWQDDLWSRLDELFKLIDQGSKSRGIPEDDLYIPAYNGGLFRTNPNKSDSSEARFLDAYQVGDSYLAEVIELLTRSQNGNDGGKIFVDYSSLDIRHLGSIYEGLLEYQLNVADHQLAVEDGEYVEAGDDDEIVVEKDGVYLTTDSGERKATGSYYTPEYVVEYIVENTLEPLVNDIRADLAGQTAHGEGGFAAEFAERIFELKILDPSMGSGHFLTGAVDYLAREIIDAQEKQADQEGIKTVNQDHDINWARRQVAQRCIYGVDLNPLAVELAKVSLWLRTLAAEQPLAFLDHHLRTGNSLVGSDIETVLDNGDPDNGTDKGQLTLQESFDRTRRQALEHVTDQFKDLLTIDNETLDDIKEMEAVYEEVRDDPLYQHLIAMANVHTADQFGLEVPDDAYKRMAKALRENSWVNIQSQDWYRSAQRLAGEQQFFHWELEFPIAFYQQDGGLKEDGGFDAVIGNPPYSKQMSDEKKKYFNLSYRYQKYQLDRYLLFMEKCVKLASNGSNIGLITPNTWLSNLNFDELRDYILTETSILSFVTYNQEVFPEVTVEPITFVLTKEKPDQNHVLVQESSEGEVTTVAKVEQSTFIETSGAVNISINPETIAIEEKFSDHSNLSDICEINLGAKPFQEGKGNPPQTREIVETKPFVSDKKEGDKFRPLLRGSLIEPHHIKWDGDYWIKFGDWLAEPRYSAKYDADKKIVARQTGDSLISAVDEDQFVVRNNMYTILPSSDEYNIYFINALYNSTFLNWYYQEIINPEKGETLAEVRKGYLTELPVPQNNGVYIEDTSPTLDKIPPEDISLEPDDVSKQRDENIHDLLIGTSKKIRNLKNKRSRLNVRLFDYIAVSGDELPESIANETLEDIQMPVAGVAETPLTETTDEYEGLRIEGVTFGDDGGQLVLSVDISYKVDEEDPRETDRWNRLAESEFETYDAMAFIGLSDNEETLLREFVPVAVEKADGFAGFREGATKTNSPLERLKELTLPDIDEVQNGLEQYIEIRERADELEEKIEKIDQVIDEIVYELYELTEEEIEIVESTVKND